ncbi:hypothetical protein LRM36_04310 [Stenotrophomonas maltophilia]|uniref:hypothetical protein n=1 Tax=Stenotrophomonas pavanii TaxID=487698 RepID=UPI0023085341|nr:hypothetical protein [Stenotrophomonas maltophilia]
MSYAKPNSSRLQSLGLLALPALAMLLVAVGIWIHAARELQPPIYDALSYVLKAKNFWAAFAERGIFNANAIEPVVRPFATVLVSYPFGYSDDFRGFYFRTNAIPSLLLGLSVFIAAGPWKSLTVRAQCTVAGLAIVALAIPSVFQFAAVSAVDVMGNWGFFDLALAAFGALAVAFAVRPGMAIRTKATWVAALAVLIIYTKPAGLSMMVMVAGIWLVIAGRQWLAGEASRRELLQGIAIFAVVYLVAGATLFGSKYFSMANYQYGVRSMELLHQAQLEFPGPGTIAHKLHISAGLAVIVLTLVGFIAALRARFWETAVLTALVMASGVWLWLGRTNAEHVRYFIPFPLMAYVLIVPMLVRESRATWLDWLVRIGLLFGLAQFVLTLVLLFQTAPSVQLQRLAGINLTSGQYSAEIRGGEALAARIATRAPAVSVVYYATFTPELLAFQSVLEYRRNLGMEGGNTIPSLPVDWVREHAYRLAEITRADHVVFPRRDPAELNAPALANIADFATEEIVTTAWLSSLGPADGVIPSDSAGIRVLDVVDRDLFIAAAVEYARTHTQRPAALEGFSPPSEHLKRLLRTPVALTLDGKPAATLTSFVLAERPDGTIARIGLQPAADAPEGNWLLFVHQIYTDGTFSDAYAPVAWATNSRAPYLVRVPDAAGKTVAAFGVGVIQPSTIGAAPRFLSRDGGDWNGTRTVLPCEEAGCGLPEAAR